MSGEGLSFPVTVSQSNKGGWFINNEKETVVAAW